VLGSDLENGSPAGRVAAFRAYTAAHPIIKEVDGELKRTILEPAGRSLVFVVGPTGVGKTTLLTKVAKHFQETELTQDARSPWIVLEASAPESTTFSWRDFYERALHILEGAPVGNQSKRSPSLLQRPYSIAQMRRMFEYAVRERRPRAVLIDEAQHLMKVSSGRKLADQMDSLKSLASFTGCVYVLIGTYE
jgi:DNA transposition AAA+ family ATPase